MSFAEEWLNAPDEVTPGVFATNADVWPVASLDRKVYVKGGKVCVKGAMVQALGCVKFRMKDKDLRRMAEEVGGRNLQILHGKADTLAPVSDAERLYEG
jgi:hypothetical protein